MAHPPLLLLGFTAVVCAAAGYWIGQSKGRATAGLALGFFLGVIGLVVIACLPRTAEKEAERQPNIARPNTPPGWWPDPWRQATYRWWDGTQWTDATHPGADQGMQK